MAYVPAYARTPSWVGPVCDSFGLVHWHHSLALAGSWRRDTTPNEAAQLPHVAFSGDPLWESAYILW